MTRAVHDRLCDKPGTPADRCRVCSYVEAGRRDAAELILARVEVEFPKPTLGIQKVIRMLEAMR